MTRSQFTLFIVLFAALLLSGFGEKPNNSDRTLKAEISTDRNVYNISEPVKMTITLINNSSEAYSAYFPSGKKYDFMVLCAKKIERWRWSRGKMFTMAVQPLMLKSRERISYAYTWDQKDNSGRNLSPGKYYIIGEIAVSPRISSEAKEIQIK